MKIGDRVIYVNWSGNKNCGQIVEINDFGIKVKFDNGETFVKQEYQLITTGGGDVK